MRVLIADDDPSLLAVVSEVVRQHGHEVEAVSSGAELVERLRERALPDLLVTDVSMPWMSGLRVVLAIRAAGLRLPIVVMTAHRDPRIEEQVAALGPAVVFLRKPFDLAALESALDAQLQPRRT